MTTTDSDASSIKVMRLRRAGTCAVCARAIEAGERASWDKTAKTVTCSACTASPVIPLPPVVPDTAPDRAAPVPADSVPPSELSAEAPAPATLERGVPGASLEKQYEHRVQARADSVRARHPRIGGMVLALTSEPPSTAAFKIGAEGERRVAEALERRCGDAVVLLHNRKLGSKRRDGDIDHVAITATGVYAVDAKQYTGATVEVRRSGGWFSTRTEALYVRGRDQTKLLAGIAKQLEAIRGALVDYPGGGEIHVGGVLCFVDAKLPMFWKDSIGGVPLLAPKATAKLLSTDGPIDAPQRDALARHLAERLPPA
jgi:hypothetical protein